MRRISAFLLAVLGAASHAGSALPLEEPGYTPPQTCAGCHRSIWETYRQTGMGRSFHRPEASRMVENWGGSYYHRASDRHYSMLRRGGKYFQRRYQIGPDGRQINVVEKEIDYVMGSGNHARAYLHRTARNTLVELPVGWYAEKGGYWAMNPGYDRPDHEGFRRKIGYDCMFCHNGYPKIPPGHEQAFAEPVYTEQLPQGIDCQRCHGPGQRHAELAGSGKASREEVRRAIVNPSRLSTERKEEVCMQCHLETTSFPLPNSLPRYGRGPFAYRPGEPLSDSWLFFDHAPGKGRGEKYELVNAVYRLRRSKCFLESRGALGCTTCHNPHDVPRGDAARQHYDAVCRRCHGASLDRAAAAGKHTRTAGCADCHMPKRRTEDVVHAVATDHYIQRRKADGDLLAELEERHETGDNAYRGEVVLYYPPKPPPGNELYLAVAQVVEKSNLAEGIKRLAEAIERYAPERVEFAYQLAEAWRQSQQPEKALPIYREVARRNPKFVPGLEGLGSALRHGGQTVEAIDVLKRAAAAEPGNPSVWHELGLAYRAEGKMPEAVAALETAAALDPDLPEAHNNLGIVCLARGDRSRAEGEFREAIRLQPDNADAQDNLANLLSAAGSFAEARHHFEEALKRRPEDAATRYNFAMGLGRAGRFEEAQQQLEAALRIDAGFADAHQLLADLLTAKGQPQAALPHYREAVRLDPESGRGQLGLGTALAMTGDVSGALPYLKKASVSTDALVREKATQLLRQLARTQ